MELHERASMVMLAHSYVVMLMCFALVRCIFVNCCSGVFFWDGENSCFWDVKDNVGLVDHDVLNALVNATRIRCWSWEWGNEDSFGDVLCRRTP